MVEHFMVFARRHAEDLPRQVAAGHYDDCRATFVGLAENEHYASVVMIKGRAEINTTYTSPRGRIILSLYDGAHVVGQFEGER